MSTGNSARLGRKTQVNFCVGKVDSKDPVPCLIIVLTLYLFWSANLRITRRAISEHEVAYNYSYLHFLWFDEFYCHLMSGIYS